jgi:flagellar biosynthesis GTPase FlhF
VIFNCLTKNKWKQKQKWYKIIKKKKILLLGPSGVGKDTCKKNKLLK